MLNQSTNQIKKYLQKKSDIMRNTEVVQYYNNKCKLHINIEYKLFSMNYSYSTHYEFHNNNNIDAVTIVETPQVHSPLKPKNIKFSITINYRLV